MGCSQSCIPNLLHLMKRLYHLIYLLLFTIAGCNNNDAKSEYVAASPLLVDSFMITGLSSGYGVCYLRFINNDTLLSYDMMERQASIYPIKFGSSNKPHDSLTVSKQPYRFSGFFVSGEDSWCKYEDDKKLWSEYTFDGQLKFQQSIGYSPNYPFFLEPGDGGLSYFQHDTFTTNLLYREFEDLEKYYNGNQLIRWVCNSNGYQLLDTFGKAPYTWHTHQWLHLLFALYGDETIYVFPDYDSLYIRNSNTKTTRALHIGNKDYTRPAPFDRSKINTPEYSQYRTTYDLANFLYKGIIHNPVTNHYILFYVKPLVWTNKEVAATYEDQPMYALVLSSELKPIQYVEFSAKYYDPSVFFNVPGKGIALPIYKMKISYEDTIQIDVFNL
jgi:hypothetical protein